MSPASGAPRITVPASATPEEAAALVAAVEQFLRDTTTAVATDDGQADGWTRAARREAVSGNAAWDGDAGVGLAAWGA